MANNDGPSGGVAPTPGAPPVTPTAKKQARQRRRARARARARRQAYRNLYDPASPLSGRPLGAVANAMTRLELQPGINAQKSAIAASRRGQRYDVSALNRMGGRLDEQMAGIVGRTGQYRNEALARVDQANQMAGERLAANNRESTDRLNSLQSQVLGNQISTLTEAGVTPGQSATDRVMGQIAQGQQQAQANQAASWSNLATLMGQQASTTAGAMGDAAQYGAEASRGEISRNIASRVADRRQMGAEERASARSELATLRGLRGSSRLKNLMELRREQQDYGARMSEIEAQRQQWNKENRLAWFDARTRRMNSQDSDDGGGGGGGGGGGEDNPRRMSRAEWQDWKSVGQEIINSNPGERITNWRAFLDEVESAEGVSWNPRERAKFKRKFKKWYNQNY